MWTSQFAGHAETAEASEKAASQLVAILRCFMDLQNGHYGALLKPEESFTT